MADNLLEVEVAYALPHHQYLLKVKLPFNSTVMHAIEVSQILKICPEIDLNKQRVGIFSKFCDLSQNIKYGDRVEIYRPLIIDPKAARRARA